MSNGNAQTVETEIEGEEIIDVEALPAESVAIGAVDRAQIDMQIATAKRYPRNIQKAIREAIALVCVDEETAGSMHYALPRQEKGKKIFITGESVRLAEVIGYVWGNLRFDKGVSSIDESYVTGQSTVFDLEKNNAGRVNVKRRITYSDKGNRKGKRYSEDMIQTTGSAGASIAFRNAMFMVIPEAVIKKVSQAARQYATGGAQPIEARRAKALSWFAKVGAEEARVLELLGVEKVDDITQEHLEILNGIKTSILDHQLTVEEAFDNPGEAQAERKTSERLESLKERLGAKQNGEGKEPPALDETGAPKNLKAAQGLLKDLFKKHGINEASPEFGPWLKSITGGVDKFSALGTGEISKVIKAIEAGNLPQAPAASD